MNKNALFDSNIRETSTCFQEIIVVSSGYNKTIIVRKIKKYVVRHA
jgi:hypothetical protein